MTPTHDIRSAGLAQRPKRADARRNYEKLVAAAREAFTEDGDAGLARGHRAARARSASARSTATSRRARHLLEAVYVDEVEAMCRSADDLADLPPWDALVGLAAPVRRLRRHQARARGGDARLRRPGRGRLPSCREAITDAGETLLERAQAAGVVRPDTNFTDVGRMVGGIAVIRTADPEQIERILDVALDGLRYRPPGG